MENPNTIDYSKLHVYPWKYPKEWAWISQRPDWLETIFKTRQAHGYNNLMIITGPLGGGKSSTAIRWAEQWDPNFTIDNIAFTPAEFTQAYMRAGVGGVVVWDEAELGIGHREFMTQLNRATTGFIQSSRYLEVSVIFTLPLMNLMDTAAIRVSQFLVRMLNRGYCRIHEIKPNEMSRSPPIYTPTIGDTRVSQPTKAMWAAYNSKRSLFHDRFFSSERFEAQEAKLVEDIEGKRKGWEEVVAHPENFRDAYGRISALKIQQKFGLSHSTAYTWRNIANGKLNGGS